MERKTSLLLFFVMLVLLFGTFTLLTAAATQDSAQNTGKQTVAQKCLACHGSYDKLAEKTANFKAASGETVTPHRYVPHADKTDIPECTECHVPHPVPLQDKSKVVKPDIVYCFTSCHHANNLQPCKNCH
jgi:NAD-dependent SIR2 family protein deacetylase